MISIPQNLQIEAKNLIKDFKTIVIDTISYSIKIIDRIFSDSKYRKKNFYINKQSIPRTIINIFGTLYFERNYYTDKNKENGFFLID